MISESEEITIWRGNGEVIAKVSHEELEIAQITLLAAIDDSPPRAKINCILRRLAMKIDRILTRK